jgi:hypothetical protein
MKMKQVSSTSLLCCVMLLQSVTSVADDYDSVFTFSTGVDFTSGTYGGDVDIEEFYVPLTATADYGRVAFRLTVPYLSVAAPEGTVIGPGGEPLPGSGELTTENGLGDIIGSVALDLAVLIKEEYPEDEATGFSEGDLRGVFWVEYPEAE